MPREPEIQPGSTFHLPAAQEKNIGNLMKIFSKREATDALTAIGKMDKDTWGSVKDTVIGLGSFVAKGGISTFKDEIRQVINNEVTGIMSPILNEFQPLFSLFYKAIEPVLPLIQDVVTWIVSFLKPIIQWIADAIQSIIDFFTVGGIFGSGMEIAQTALEALGLLSDDPDEVGTQTTPGGFYDPGLLGAPEGPYGDY